MLKAIKASYRILETFIQSFRRAMPRSMLFTIGVAILFGFIFGPFAFLLFLFGAWIIFLDIRMGRVYDRLERLERKSED